MMMLSMVSLLVGVVLGQRFKVIVLIPATAIVVLAVATGVTPAQTAWSIILMVAAAATSMQIGYLIGIGVRHVLAASSSLTSPTASSPARQPAR